MLTLTRISVIFVTVCVSSHVINAENDEVLQDIFASAVARTATSLTAVTETLNPEWAATVNISSQNASCLDSASNFSALSACLQEDKVVMFVLSFFMCSFYQILILSSFII